MVQVTTRLDTDPAQVARARAVVADAVQSWGRDDGELVMLLVSELVTNAIVHGKPPMELVASLTRGGLRVEVHDSASGAPTPREPLDRQLLEPGGRGLTLVAALADRWGWSPNGAGKVVWFELD